MLSTRYTRPLVAAGVLAALAACSDTTAPADAPTPPLRVPGGAAFSPVMAIQDQAIDQNDTYVAGDATLSYTTYVQTSEPVVDPVTNQSTTELTFTPPQENVHIEAGYDVYDRPIVNTYSLTAEPDPQTDLADETRTVKALGAQHTIYDASGYPLSVSVPAGSPGNSPMEGLTYEGAQVTDGMLLDASAQEVVTSYSMSPSLRPGGQPGTVKRIGSDRIQITATFADLAQSAPRGLRTSRALSMSAGSGQETGTVKRTYAKHEDKYVLEEVLIESETRTDKGTVRGKQQVRFKNVKWHINKDEDKKRKDKRDKASATGSLAPSSPRAAMVQQDNCLIDEYGNPCDNGGGGDPGSGGTYTDPCGPVAGGQNVVLQHGILSDSSTWTKRMQGWLRCDWQLGAQITPSLPSLSSHSDQSYQQMSRIEQNGGTGFVLIGHSQGGLVSRYSAQRFAAQGRGNLVEGVISVGTPHQGAILARNMKQGALNGMYSLLGTAGRCGSRFLDVTCHIASYVTQRVLDGWLTGMMNAFAPATVDLQPGSPSLNYLNSQPEGFARFGIQHYPKKRWMPMRILGDMGDEVKGPEWVRYTEWAYQGLRVCNYASIFFGQFWLTQACGTAHRTMDSVDRWYDHFTAPGMQSDGIVHGPSQVYPNGMEQRPIPGGESHVGETKSLKTRQELNYLLQNRFYVSRR